jgi:probable HAF family extracellular repeat protein
MYKIQALRGPATKDFPDSDSQAYGINSHSSVAGIAFPALWEPGIPFPVPYAVGAIWVGGNLNFSLPLKSESFLYSINSSGDAVGVQGTGNTPTEVAILVRGGSVTDLSPVVGVGSLATHINDSGLVCGWTWNNPRGFVYDARTNAVTAWINPLPGKQQSGAAAINAYGEVVGMSDGHAFLFSSGSEIDLGPAAFVTGVNNAGVVCGSVGKPFPQNFAAAFCDAKKPSPSFVEIYPPAGFTGSHGEGINSSGDVVGTCWNQNTYNGAQSAYLFHEGLSTDLNTMISSPGWHLEFAHDINDSGEITGTGTFYGQQTAFLLTPKDWRHGIFTLPELVATLLGGVDRDGGGWRIIGGHPIPEGPWGPFIEISPAKRDALVALAMDEISMFLIDRGAREKVRGALIEVARGRLETLMQDLGEGRVGPGFAMPTEVRSARSVRNMQNGKPVEALRRFRLNQ